INEFAPESKTKLHTHLAYVHRGFIWGSPFGGTALQSRVPEPAVHGSGEPCHQRPDTDGTPVPLSLAVVPYHAMLHRFESRRRLGAQRGRGTAADARLKAGRAIDTFLDFAPGDYVVHRDHGIAIFQGLVTMKPREVKRDTPVVLPSDRPKKKDRRS